MKTKIGNEKNVKKNRLEPIQVSMTNMRLGHDTGLTPLKMN
jgi:hypothetical protein